MPRSVRAAACERPPAGEQLLGGGLGLGGDGATSTVTTPPSATAPALHPHVADVVAAGGEDEVGGDVEVGAVEHGHEVQAAQVDRDDVGVLARPPASR